MTDRQFDPHWPHGHETMDGKPARIICRDMINGKYPLLVLVLENDGNELSIELTENGDYWEDDEVSPYDLRNRPGPKPTAWVVSYGDTEQERDSCCADGDAYIYWDEAKARREADAVQKRWNYVKVSKFEEVPL